MRLKNIVILTVVLLYLVILGIYLLSKLKR
jgi:hypothetical protein